MPTNSEARAIPVEKAMMDETPDTGDVLLDLLFAAGAAVTIGAMMLGVHTVTEALWRKDKNEELGR
jgi:hypothetical protein